jgi:hypothetical protein
MGEAATFGRKGDSPAPCWGLKSEKRSENRKQKQRLSASKMGKRVSLSRYRSRCFFFALKYKNSVFEKKKTDCKFAS